MGPLVVDTSCHLPSGPGWEGCSPRPNLFLHWPSWPAKGGQGPAFLPGSSSSPRFCQRPEPLPCGSHLWRVPAARLRQGQKGERGGVIDTAADGGVKSCEVSVPADRTAQSPPLGGRTVRTGPGQRLTPFLRCYPGSQHGWAFTGAPPNNLCVLKEMTQMPLEWRPDAHAAETPRLRGPSPRDREGTSRLLRRAGADRVPPKCLTMSGQEQKRGRVHPLPSSRRSLTWGSMEPAQVPPGKRPSGLRPGGHTGR